MTAREAIGAGRDLSSRVLKAVRRIVGIPDYDAYVAHVRKHHPETEPLTPNAFLEKCWKDKYSQPGNRCC